MPLRAATAHTQVKYYFVTAGPWNPELNTSTMRDEVELCVTHQYGKLFKRAAASFEVGYDNADDPYRHLHIAIELNSEGRWAKCNKALRKVVSGWGTCEGEHRKVSTRFFTAGHCEDPWGTMTQYLIQPSKEKEVGEFLEFAERDYAKELFYGCEGVDKGLYPSVTIGWYATVFGFTGKAHKEWCKKIYYQKMKEARDFEVHKKKYPHIYKPPNALPGICQQKISI